jgi:peroxiredoxin
MTSPLRRYRILVLPLAALVISGLVWLGYRIQQLEQRTAQVQRPRARRQPAPRFELWDQSSPPQIVKFERYLGRTQLVVVFFDGEAGADRDPWLTQLRDHHDKVQAAGVQVIGISTATPYANREAEKRSTEFPFPLLSDIGKDTPAPAHTLWGRFDPSDGTYHTGVFLVDRSGMVETDGRSYQPVADPEAVVRALCTGQWPE